MRLRTLAAATALSVATTMGGGALFVATESSSAAAAPARTGITQSIPCAPSAGAVPGTCSLTVNSLQAAANRTLNAVVTVTARNANGQTASQQVTLPVLDPPATCPILSLTLGPLHLNLLGLVVDLNQVVLNITAVPGPGNLLGNLLCAVANLLNSSASSTALNNLLNLINGILGGL